jgi:hypothetical protein
MKAEELVASQPNGWRETMPIHSPTFKEEKKRRMLVKWTPVLDICVAVRSRIVFLGAGPICDDWGSDLVVQVCRALPNPTRPSRYGCRARQHQSHLVPPRAGEQVYAVNVRLVGGIALFRKFSHAADRDWFRGHGVPRASPATQESHRLEDVFTVSCGNTTSDVGYSVGLPQEKR